MRSIGLLRRAGAIIAAASLTGLGATAAAAASSPDVIVIGTIANQVDALGTTIAPIQVKAGDTSAETLTYSETGLPPGLSINATTGLIAGTITTDSADGGAYAVTITVTDTSATSASISFSWDVHGTITITAAPSNVVLNSGAPYSVQVQAQDSVPGQQLTYSLVSKSGLPPLHPNVLPTGLTLSAAGRISGVTATLPGAGGVTFVMTGIFVSDGIGAQTGAAVIWNIELNPGESLAGPVKADAAGKCVSVGGPAGDDARAVEISRCASGADQQWQVGQDGTLQAAGLCLTVPAGHVKNGMAVLATACAAPGSSLLGRQAWTNQGTGLLSYRAGRCLIDPSRSARVGTKLEISTCRQSPAQTWQLPTGQFASARGLCASDLWASTADGARVVLARCKSAKAQRWTAELDDTIRIQGRCLDAAGRRAVGDKVVLNACNGTAGEFWYSFPDGEVINQRLCLTTLGGGNLNGRQLRVVHCNGDIPERWRLR